MIYGSMYHRTCHGVYELSEMSGVICPSRRRMSWSTTSLSLTCPVAALVEGEPSLRDKFLTLAFDLHASFGPE